MAGKRGWHLWAIALWSAMTVCTMLLLLLVTTDRPDDAPARAWWVYPMVFVPPAVAILAATASPPGRPRITLLWLSAWLMTVPAAFGIFGGWGLLYVIGIIFALAAAWCENRKHAIPTR